MPLTLASCQLSDAAFLTALEDCSLPLEQFRHGDHLRLAWLKLHAYAVPDALNSVRVTIRAFARHHGKAAIYHETITTAWVALLASHTEPTFADFLSANQHLLDAKLLERYWSPQTLYSPDARDGWVPPDRDPLPTDPSILISLTEGAH